jgi:hypothetical protein
MELTGPSQVKGGFLTPIERIKVPRYVSRHTFFKRMTTAGINNRRNFREVSVRADCWELFPSVTGTLAKQDYQMCYTSIFPKNLSLVECISNAAR